MDPNAAVSTIMTTQIVTVQPDTPATVIDKLFKQQKFHHLPVVEAGSKLVGIISREDFTNLYHHLSLNTTGKTWTEMEFNYLTADAIMTKYPLTLQPDDSIGLAADIFLANRFHALPIVEDGMLTGLVTSHDLLAYCFAQISPIPNSVAFEED